MRVRRRIKVPKDKCGSRVYRSLHRIVDGAVSQCFLAHPEYIASGIREDVVRASIEKRVVGAIIGFLGESQKLRSTAVSYPPLAIGGGGETKGDS